MILFVVSAVNIDQRHFILNVYASATADPIYSTVALRSCNILIIFLNHCRPGYKHASFPSTEEVADWHQPDCGGVAPRGRGKLLGKALFSPAADVPAGIQQPLDVLQPVVQGLQASPGLCQRPQTGGEILVFAFADKRNK